MSATPLTYLEKKWASGYGSNNLIPAATQDNNKPSVPLLDYDLHTTITNLGRRTLMSLGRRIYVENEIIRGAVDETARLSASTFTPQFVGKNADWGRRMELIFAEEDKYIDIRGRPHTMATNRRNIVISLFREGEIGVQYCEDENGEAKTQWIPSHRIGSRDNDRIVQGGKFDGARIIDGVIVNDYGRPLAYRVYGERVGYSDYTDVPANDFELIFIPSWPDQIRGFSLIGMAAIEAISRNESKKYELHAQLINSSIAAQVHNETGTPDKTKQLLGARATAADSTGAATSLPSEILQSGRINYAKAGTGQKIEFPTPQRPSTNYMAFHAEGNRATLHGMGLNIDFSYDPTKAGGAQMRVVVEKINSSFHEIQELGIKPALTRQYGWRAAKHINNKRIEDEVEWYKFEFQGPQEVTADEKYSSDTALQDVRAGFKSPQQVIEQQGKFWEDVQDDIIAYEKRLQERSKVEGVNVDRLIQLTPNGNSSVSSVEPDQKSQPTENP